MGGSTVLALVSCQLSICAAGVSNHCMCCACAGERTALNTLSMIDSTLVGSYIK